MYDLMFELMYDISDFPFLRSSAAYGTDGNMEDTHNPNALLWSMIWLLLFFAMNFPGN